MYAQKFVSNKLCLKFFVPDSHHNELLLFVWEMRINRRFSDSIILENIPLCHNAQCSVSLANPPGFY